jgi:hypothetical protein
MPESPPITAAGYGEASAILMRRYFVMTGSDEMCDGMGEYQRRVSYLNPRERGSSRAAAVMTTKASIARRRFPFHPGSIFPCLSEQFLPLLSMSVFWKAEWCVAREEAPPTLPATLPHWLENILPRRYSTPFGRTALGSRVAKSKNL